MFVRIQKNKNQHKLSQSGNKYERMHINCISFRQALSPESRNFPVRSNKSAQQSVN